MFQRKRLLCCCVMTSLILIFISMSFAQEINWYSMDQGGGTSSANDISISGVIGQVDVVRMEGSSITVSSGYFPMPADLIFENQFDIIGEG